MHLRDLQPKIALASRWQLLLAGLAALLLTACSTPQKISAGPSLWEMLETSNVERVDGGTTFVFRTLPSARYYPPYYSGYLRYPPYWLGGYYPYYALYYPYYGYRPHYVWSCPVAPWPAYPGHPGDIRGPGEPFYNAGSTPPVNSADPVSPIYTGPVELSPYAALEPDYRRGGSMPFTTDILNSPALSRATGSLSGSMAAAKIQLDRDKIIRGFQRPDQGGSVNLGQQRLSPGFGASTSGGFSRSAPRPSRSFSRPAASPRGRTSGISGIRLQSER